MEYSIRRLASDDLPLLRELNGLFAQVFDDNESYASNVPADDYLINFLGDTGHHIVLVAVANGQVVGGLVAYVLTKFEQARREVYIYDLAVHPNHRRRGIGKRLFENCKQVAHDDGAYVVFVQADEGDDAVKFYESLGPDENLRTWNFDFLV